MHIPHVRGRVAAQAHVGLPDGFPPLDEDDLGNLHKGIELFVFFCEVVPHQHQADDDEREQHEQPAGLRPGGLLVAAKAHAARGAPRLV